MRNDRKEDNFTAAKPHESTVNRKLTVRRDQFWPKTRRLEQQTPTTGIERSRQEQQALSASVFIQIKRKIKNENENEKRAQLKSFIKQIRRVNRRNNKSSFSMKCTHAVSRIVYMINKSP